MPYTVMCEVLYTILISRCCQQFFVGFIGWKCVDAFLHNVCKQHLDGAEASLPAFFT